MDFRYPVLIRSGKALLHAVYHIPVAVQSPYPLVIMCHGLGGDKVGRHRFFVQLAERLAFFGIASLRFDFEGCGDSEGDFSSMTVDRWVQNMEAVFCWVDANPLFQRLSVGLFGRSFGGVLAVRAAGMRNSCCAVALQSSPFDSMRYMAPHSTVPAAHICLDDQRKTVVFLGEELSIRLSQELQQLNMADSMQKISSMPFFYISCKNDIIVDSYHAQKFRESRACVASETSFLELASSDHSCSNVEDRKVALHELANWFSLHLKIVGYP